MNIMWAQSMDGKTPVWQQAIDILAETLTP